LSIVQLRLRLSSSIINMNRSYYSIKRLKTLPANFVELSADDATREFLRESKARRSVAKDAIATMLKNSGYSTTDANALVDRGRMFVFGRDHLAKLFGGTPPSGQLLLDVGAGDGHITSHVSPMFERVVATEFSKPMVKRLREKGFFATSKVDALDDPSFLGKHCYDLVMMLNVLDRADKPLTLLKQLRSMMNPKSGHLILAVVLPWCPFVEDGKKQKRPSEKLPMKGGGLCVEGASFEQSVTMMTEKVLIPAGFDVVSWTKLPYLCEGDGTKEYYVLDDAVFVLKARKLDDDDEDDDEVVEPGILQPGKMEDLPATGVADWMLQKLL
jgi:2-polyprenyl-3-methyl-5-hydroxy-6-metoxy-1,4-benzoquinol methylase